MKKTKLTILAAGLSVLAASTVATAQTKPEAPEAKKPAKEATVKADKWDFVPEVVATVGDQKITKQEFIKDAQMFLAGKRMSAAQLPPQALKQLAPGILEGIIDKIAMLKIAEKAGFKPSKELVKTEFEKMMKNIPPQQKQQFDQMLKAQKMTAEQYAEKMSNDKFAQEGLAIDSWIQKDIISKVSITEKDLKEFYEKNKDQFKMPETIEASHILIKPENEKPEAKAAAKKKAEDILEKLTKGSESFEKLAEQESACPSGKKAKGSLGKFPRGQMVKEFEDAAFALEPGKLSGVVETKFGYHIIKVTGKEKEKEFPFDQVKAFIEQRMKTQKIQEAIKSAVTAEKKNMVVKTNLKK
jgi:peptidyl-prolyl cis-trans isomerase C